MAFVGKGTLREISWPKGAKSLLLDRTAGDDCRYRFQQHGLPVNGGDSPTALFSDDLAAGKTCSLITINAQTSKIMRAFVGCVFDGQLMVGDGLDLAARYMAARIEGFA